MIAKLKQLTKSNSKIILMFDEGEWSFASHSMTGTKTTYLYESLEELVESELDEVVEIVEEDEDLL